MSHSDSDAVRVRRVTAGQIAAAPPEGPAQVMYAGEAERQLRAAGRCWYQTGSGLPGFEYCAHPAPPAEPTAGPEQFAGLCIRHARQSVGIEDPDLAVGDRVYELDPDADPSWHGTITAASNNGYRVRWDGQNGDLATGYGEVAPVRPALRVVVRSGPPTGPQRGHREPRMTPGLADGGRAPLIQEGR